MPHDFPQARARMVAEQLRPRGIRDRRVLETLEAVPRHRFVDAALSAEAYRDRPLPIGHGQTISQPYMVALMTELLEPHPAERVLEIGTGSGYQAAVLARLVRTVFTIERLAPLVARSRAVFAELAITNILQRGGDGTLGWPQYAPYDGIVVTAGAPEVPAALLTQLADGGRLVVPTGSRGAQTLVVVERRAEQFVRRAGIGCTFVPLIGEEGWQGD